MSIPLPFTGLYIASTAVYGNANLLVSVAGINGVPVNAVFPTSATANYSSSSLAAGVGLGADGVVLYPTDLAVRSQCSTLSRASSFCTLLVTVTSTGAPASILLLASLDGARTGATGSP